MGPWRLVGACWAVFALAGCGSSEEYEVDPGGGLPVACVARTGASVCRGGAKAFYYDYRENRCKPVVAGGCAGHTVFDTKKKCVSYCGAQP